MSPPTARVRALVDLIQVLLASKNAQQRVQPMRYNLAPSQNNLSGSRNLACQRCQAKASNTHLALSLSLCLKRAMLVYKDSSILPTVMIKYDRQRFPCLSSQQNRERERAWFIQGFDILSGDCPVSGFFGQQLHFRATLSAHLRELKGSALAKHLLQGPSTGAMSK